MKVTRADVARLAGVSTATVSYVLNNSRSISEKTRERVMAAVRQLNYKPDLIARSMTTNETMQLSMMINDITNPFFSEIAVGFENAAIKKGYFVNICTGLKNVNDYFDNYVARRIDGVFVAAVPNKFDLNKLYNLTDNGIKVIVSGNAQADLKRVSAVENDYASGMDIAVSYLQQLGHRHIAYLSGFGKKHTFDRKLDAYLSAMQKYGLGKTELLLEGRPPYHTSIKDGYAMAQELIKSGKEFTAVICTNDLMAMGAVSALIDAGLQVPSDVSVIGFDDIAFSGMWRPSLTTLAVSKMELGHRAFELLYSNIKNGNTGYFLSGMELKVRGSTAAAKRQ